MVVPSSRKVTQRGSLYTSLFFDIICLLSLKYVYFRHP